MNCFRIIRNWKRWIGFVVIVTYIVLLLIALPLCVWELEKKGAPDHVEAWFVGGLFVMMSLPISLWGILQHVLNYTCPHLQRHIIRILWMVPIYALNAWFGLRFPSAAIYLDTLRECYEAYVIYNFMAYLMSFLHHEYPHLEIQIENKPPVKHIFPLCLLPPCQNGMRFVQRCKHGVLQYTIVRPTMTLIAVFCEMTGKYGEGDFNFTTAWSYIVIINNVSQVIAMYCLVMFYRAFKEELKPIKPVPKFLCVKAVVFMSFWQIVVIAALVKLNLIPQNGTWVFYQNAKEVATGLQDFLICIEMFLAAIAHYFSFSHKPFVNMAAEQRDCCTSFLTMWNISDVTEDVVEHARYVGNGVQKTLFNRLRRRGEYSPLLDNENSSSENLPANQAASSATRGFDEDSISDTSGRHYNSFADRSLSPSMTNYAEFSESVDVLKQKPKHGSASFQADERSGNGSFAEEENETDSSSSLGKADSAVLNDPFTPETNSPIRSHEISSNVAKDNDNEFEHLAKVEDASDIEEEEKILNDGIAAEKQTSQAGQDPVV